MLSRAVQEQEQDRAPVSSFPRQHAYNTHTNALKSSQTSTINAQRSFPPPYRNPLKRTASQASGWATHSCQEPAKKVLKIPNSMARVGSLHENVFFDENDFDDDNAIDLEEEEPISAMEKRSAPNSQTPTIHNHHITPPSKASISSAPLPWSSSPLAQSATLPPQPPAAKSSAISTPTLSKRRTIPWLTDQAAEGQYGRMHDKGPPAHVKKYLANQAEKTSNHMKESFTPLPNPKAESPYPWNKTASAVKKEQKRLRQGHRTLVKSEEGDILGESRAKTKKKESYAKVFLSDEQKSVLELVTERNKSVFFTGSAGTGKSVLLRDIIRAMRDRYKREPDRVAVTASTGLAACNIGGVTLHSFAGFGLGKEAAPELVRKIKKNQKAKNRWMRTKVLIIDEVSMVDGDLFDKLEEIARLIRNNGRPFGGIQLVITGDFFQLPPVPDYSRASKFAFDAATWNTSIEHTIGLTQVFRQKDPVFANMLNEMRLGRLTPNSISAFRALQRPLAFQDDFEATELFPTRIEVDSANSARMTNLAGKEFEFKAVDGGSIQDPAHRDKLLSNCMAPQSITLKKGAQVMLIKNIDDSLVNGSVGKVIAFMDEKTFDIYHEDEDGFQAIETTEVTDKEMTKSREKLKQFMNKDSTANTSQKWPLVRFSIADGTSRDLLCQREQWNIELPSGEVQASRSQIPLILAWALSIHKAQGQTLDRVKVDLGKIFEKGQAYVALSRATRQDGLQISRFDPKKVMAHDRVRVFYDGLYSVNHTANSSGY